MDAKSAQRAIFCFSVPEAERKILSSRMWNSVSILGTSNDGEQSGSSQQIVSFGRPMKLIVARTRRFKPGHRRITTSDINMLDGDRKLCFIEYVHDPPIGEKVTLQGRSPKSQVSFPGGAKVPILLILNG
jgi:hypothetical protein